MRSITLFFCEGHVIFYNTRQNLWLLNSFCSHKRKWIDKRERRDRKKFVWIHRWAQCWTGCRSDANVRADTNMVHFWAIWVQNIYSCTVWPQDVLVLTLYEKKKKSKLFSWIQIEIKLHAGLMTHIHLNFSSSMSLVKKKTVSKKITKKLKDLIHIMSINATLLFISAEC